MTSSPPIRAHASALTAIGLIVFILCAGTPGLSAWGQSTFQSEADRARLIARNGPLAGNAAIALADLNRALRLPMTRRLNRIEQTFRIRQLWNLFTSGPDRACRLEVWVDGALVYRTMDPAHRWLAPQLGHRKLRPVVDSLATKADAYNWRGLGRFLVTAARQDFPDAAEVVLVGTRARFGSPDSTPHHGRRASAATGWELQPLDADQLPDSTP